MSNDDSKFADRVRELLDKREGDDESDDPDGKTTKATYTWGGDNKITTNGLNISLGVKHTKEEKAYFHAIKAARRLAEQEYHRESAEIARVIGEWFAEVSEEDNGSEESDD